MPTDGLKIAFLVFGSAIGSTIYVVLPMIISELTPHPQRAAMLAITTSVVTFAGVLAPRIMGSMIQNAATPLAGFLLRLDGDLAVARGHLPGGDEFARDDRGG